MTPEEEIELIRIRARARARSEAERQENRRQSEGDMFDIYTLPFGGGRHIRAFANAVTDPTTRQVLGENIARIPDMLRNAPPLNQEQALLALTGPAAPVVAPFLPQTGASMRRAASGAGEQLGQAARAAPEAAQRAVRNPNMLEPALMVGAGPAAPVVAPFLPQTREQILQAAPHVPGMVGEMVSEMTYRPMEDIHAAQRELNIERATTGDEARMRELSDYILQRTGSHALNVAFAPANAALIRGAGGAVVRGAERLPRMGRRPTLPQPDQHVRDMRDYIGSLESEFGPMTAGERAANPYSMQREARLRRAGPDEAQQTLRDYDNLRAPVMEDRLMRRVATRGLEPRNPDLASAGNTLADELRTQRETMLTERAGRYRRAFELAGEEKIAPTDELLSTVLATSREHFGNLDSAAIQIIRELHGEIALGQATYARVERARQALTAELGDAMRAGNGRQVDAIHRIIDDLDAFVTRPESGVSARARQELQEARRYSSELSGMYGEQLRPELATGQTGRRDLGGRVVRNIIEQDIAGERVMDSIFGAGARPSQSTFAAVRRIVENARRQIVSTGYEATTGTATGQAQRTAGRPALPGRRTKGERTFAPTAAEEARFGAELPRDDLQALREAFVYRLRRPLTNRIRGDEIPARTIATNLRQALEGHGSEITKLLFNEQELAALRRAQHFYERVAPPSGSYFPSAPGIAQDAVERSFMALVSRLLGKVGMPNAGEAIRTGIVNARAVRDARAAVAPPPPRPSPPRGAAPPSGGDVNSRVPGMLTGAGIGGSIVASGGEASAQEGEQQQRREDLLARISAAEQRVSELENEAAIVARGGREQTEETLIPAQRILNQYGLYEWEVDGVWGDRTRTAIRQFNEENSRHAIALREASTELRGLRETEFTERITPSAEERHRQDLMLWGAAGGGALLGKYGLPIPRVLGRLPVVGPTLGRLSGAGGRAATARGVQERLARQTAQADEIAAGFTGERVGRTGRRSVASDIESGRRAAAVNSWYDVGNVPANRQTFAVAQGQLPIVRQGARDASEVFKPPRFGGADYGWMGVGGLEAGTAGAMLPDAHDKLRLALEVYDRTPIGSPEREAALIRVQEARELILRLEMAWRVGAGYVGGRVAGGYLQGYGNLPRPNIAPVQAEQQAIARYVSRPSNPPLKRRRSR